MITIGKIPQKVQSFFKTIKHNPSAHVYNYYCNLVIAICISHGTTIQKLVNLLRASTHRTNHGEFLCRSNFDEIAVVQAQAAGILKRLFKKGHKNCLLIIDRYSGVKRFRMLLKFLMIKKLFAAWKNSWRPKIGQFE